MIHNVYSIFDSATEMYMKTFQFITHNQAIRFFDDGCQNAETDLARHPKDYALYFVGRFDDNKGEFLPTDKVWLTDGTESLARSRQVDGAQLDLVDKVVNADNME